MTGWENFRGMMKGFERVILDETVKVQDAAAPTAGARMRFVTTAYCQGQTTASGVGVTTGIVAAKPAPAGKDAGKDGGKVDGPQREYLVTATGVAISG